MDYSYWKTHIENFKNQFGSELGINCDLIIPDDYSQNIPAIGFDNIIIPSQFLNLLNGHCNWILSNQNLFQNIGNWRNERISQESFGKIDYNLSSDDFKIKYLSDNFCNQVPLDDRRQKVSAILRDLITYFAIHHELGHARQKNYEISLEVSCGKSQDENWYNQAKEVDADIFGINWLWRLVFKNYYPFKSSETFKKKTEVLEICLYSTLLFFELSSKNNDPQSSDVFRTHPHPFVRLKIVAAFIEDIVVKNFLTKEEFYRVTRTVVKEFDKTCTYHFGKKLPKFSHDEMKKAISILQKYLKSDLSLNCNRPYYIE